MTSNRTVKYHVPNQGLYVYSRKNGEKAELIILNSTDREQILKNSHYRVLTKESLTGRNVVNGKTVDLQRPLVLPAGQSLIIEY